MSDSIYDNALICSRQCGYKYEDLPKSWSDLKWIRIKDSCGLTAPEVTALQREIAFNAVDYKRMRKGSAQYALRRIEQCGGVVPKDLFNTRQWLAVQKKADLGSVHLTALRHEIAVLAEEEKIAAAVSRILAVGSWLDPVTRGDRSAPYTKLHRRRKLCM